MSETEQMYSAKEVATALGVGAAMLRRYAATYERLSGTEIQIHKRDGRLFTQEQLDTLLAARAIVQRQDMSVDAALETVLRGAEMPLAPRTVPSTSVDALALTEALRASVTEPLLNELQSIRAELEALRSDADRGKQLEPSAKQADTERHGLLVRLALWVERRLRS
jgi:DNA-binding transcriptional MerR regulator